MPSKVSASLSVTAKTLTPFTGKSGFYASRLPDKESALEIMRIMSDLCHVPGLEFEDIEELHCTVMYSPDKVPSSLVVDITPKTTWIIDASIFGTALVLRLFRTSQLSKRFNLLTSLGCDPTFPDYQPHITIAKITDPDGKEAIVEALGALLQLSPVPITLGGEIIEDVNP